MSLVAGYGRRAALALVAASAAGALLVAASPARAETFASTVDIVGSGYDLDVVQMNGSVETAKRACRRNREVEMSVTNDLGEKKFSTDHASDNGFWGGEGVPSEAPVSARAFAPKKKLDAKHSCAAGSDDTNF